MRAVQEGVDNTVKEVGKTVDSVKTSVDNTVKATQEQVDKVGLRNRLL